MLRTRRRSRGTAPPCTSTPPPRAASAARVPPWARAAAAASRRTSTWSGSRRSGTARAREGRRTPAAPSSAAAPRCRTGSARPAQPCTHTRLMRGWSGARQGGTTHLGDAVNERHEDVVCVHGLLRQLCAASIAKRRGEATRLAACPTLSHHVMQLGRQSLPLGCRHTRRRNPKLLGKLSASTVSLKLCEGSLEPWPAALRVVGDPKRGKRGRIRSGPNGALLGETEEIGLHVIRLTAYRRLVRLHATAFARRCRSRRVGC